MKKIIIVMVFLFLTTPLLAQTDYAEEKEKPTHSPLKRMGIVLGRGAVNLVTLPVELPRTTWSEIKNHPRGWPFSFLPRMVVNTIFRGTSAIYDVTLYTLYAPFTDKITPLTEHMRIPLYPWQFNDDEG